MATPGPSSSTKKAVRFAPEISQQIAEQSYDGSVKHIKKGFALIISHENFDLDKKNRVGNSKDLKKLRKLMKFINFDLRVLHDKNKDILLRDIESLFCADLYNLPEYSNRKRPLPEHQCIIVIVLTHGDSGGILYAKDMVTYATEDVWKPFITANLNKPLIFIFQACRGIVHDKGRKMSSQPDSFGNLGVFETTRSQTPASHVEADAREGDTSKITVLIPNAPNVLVAFSTVEDHASWRDTSQGTFYIHQLYLAMVQGVQHGEDFATILTKAQQNMADENITYDVDCHVAHRVKQMPSYTSFLTYKLYFQSTNTLL